MPSVYLWYVYIRGLPVKSVDNVDVINVNKTLYFSKSTLILL